MSLRVASLDYLGIVAARLTMLSCLQVQQFSNKSVDMSLRVASLDYLGIVAARLRKDAVSSRLNEEVIHEIIGQVVRGTQLNVHFTYAYV